MTQLELVQSALRHEASSRVPYAIHLTGEGYAAYGPRLMKDYPDPRVEEDYRKGIITLEQATALTIGNHMTYIYPPWWQWHNLTDVFLKHEDTPQTLPNTIGTGSYERFFEVAEYLAGRYPVYFIATVWGSHWEKAYFSRGIENFLYDLAGSPEWAQSLLDLIIRKNLVMLENILDVPHFHGVLLGSDWGTQRDLIMSPSSWQRMIRPGEQQEYDLVHRYGKDVIIHSCGNVEKILPSLVEMGVDMLNPVQPECMDLRALKRDFGQLCYYGGISTQKTLPYGTPKDVIRETEDTILLMSQNGGYVTAPSQEIQTDVPYENLRALIDTARAAAHMSGQV